MTELLSDLTTPSDAELISSVRGGDVAAYGELFARHKDAANRLARQLVRGPDADDLVSEAFAKVLTVLQGGGGPDVAFRAYLLTAVRRLHVDKMRAGAKTQPSDDMSVYDDGIPFQDTAVAAFESGAAAKAFATLPERWQLVLWHLEVEGQKPADIAPLLGMSPNSVSALAYRAREGLRQAFLTMHLNDTSETDCRWVNEHLGAYVRKGLSNRDAAKVRSHLDGCRRCTAMYLELTEVNSNLAGIIAPLLLGGAAAGYLASSGAAAGGLGLAAVFGRVRDVVSANAGAATAAGVAAGVAAVATAGVLLLPSGGEQVATIKDPSAISSPAATPPSSALATPDDDARDDAPKQDRDAESEEETSDEAETDDGTTAPAVATEPNSPGDAPAAPGPAGDVPPGQDVDPGPAGSVTSDVSFSTPVSFDGDALSFTIAGDPLPPTIGLRLVSDPGGIEFRENGSACTLTSPTRADCSTGALARGGFAMQRGMALAPRSFTGSIRLRVPVDQPDTEVRLIVSVPEGYTDPSDPDSNASSFQYKPKKAAPADPGTPAPGTPAQPGSPTQPTQPSTPSTPPGTTPPGTTPPGTTPPGTTPPVDPPPVDPPVDPPLPISVELGLAGFPAAVEFDAKADTYGVSGRLEGLHPAMTEVTVTLTGDARVASTGDSLCQVVNEEAGKTTMECSPGGATSLDLLMDLTEPAGKVRIEVMVPDGFKDDDTDGLSPNFFDITLLEAPIIRPFAYVVGPTAAATDTNNLYAVTATVSGLPEGAESISFRAVRSAGNPADFQAVTTPAGACTSDQDRLTCKVATGSDTFVLGVLVRLPGNQNFALEATAGDETISQPLNYLPGLQRE